MKVASGVVLVGGLLVLGVGMAVMARTLRVPGSAPRVRMFPSEPEAKELERRARLAPAPLLRPRLAARVSVVEAGSGTPLPAASARAAGPEALRSEELVAPGVRLLDFGPRTDVPPSTVAVAFACDEMPPTVRPVPVAVSRRGDGLDAPLSLVELAPPPEGRGTLVVAVRAEGGGRAPAPVPVLLHRVHDPSAPCSGPRTGEVDPAAAAGGTFAGLRAGRWRVEARVEGPSGPAVLASAEVEVPRGGRAEVSLALSPAAGVLDLAVEDPGAPGASPPVRLQVVEGGPARALGAPGSRRLLLAPGSYRVRVLREGRAPAEEAFDLVAGATVRRKVVLRPSR